MLVALTDLGERRIAAEAPKGPAYRCPVCADPVVLKKGSGKIHHFAHRPGSICSHRGESPLHLAMKFGVFEALRACAGERRVEVEWPVAGRIADVWMREPDGREIVVECQRSAMSTVEIKAKLDDYAAAGLPCLYIAAAEAFTQSYNKDRGITSLHNAEVTVPGWILDSAIPDPSTHRGLAAFYEATDTLIMHRRVLTHVWERGRLWAVAFEIVYRDVLRGYTLEVVDTVPKIRKRHAMLRCEVDPSSPIIVEAASGRACYAALWELRAVSDEHPTVEAALHRAPPVLNTPRRRRRAPRCSPTASASSATRDALPSPPPPPAAPTPSPPAATAPQLGLALGDEASPSPRRSSYWH